MKVLGTVKDAATEVPLPGAKIQLYVREEELAVLQSDSEGKFEHKSESQYIGEILICKVEKAGYEPQKVIQEFEEDEVTLAIKLVPGEDEKIELTFNLKDDNKNSLKGVNVSLELDGEGVGVGISDKDGIFKISLSPDFEGKTINYKAELGGFELASGAVLLKKETSVKITMKKLSVPPSDKKSFWTTLPGILAAIAAILTAMVALIGFISPPPVISYFDSSPDTISPGNSSNLSWIVSDATSVTIDPEIGSVELTGTRVVSPAETTDYTLKVKNIFGKDASFTVIVFVQNEEDLPVINYFEASPSAISAEEGSTLRWSVSDATSVTIDPEIGSVALTGTRQASPTETTTYTLTATNEAGKRDATVEVVIEIPPDETVINYFEASPSKIKPDENATLNWSVSGAASVTIDPEIGNVGLTDTKVVSPTETTTYTLTATNDAGSIDATVEVLVGTTPLLPDLFVSKFSVDPSPPKPGSPVAVRVGVYNQGTDRSGAFTVQWWADERDASPAHTWRVNSLAIGEIETLTHTYNEYPSRHGSFTTKVVVDFAGEVAESDEENNVDRVTIGVSEPSGVHIVFDALPDGTPISSDLILNGDEFLSKGIRLEGAPEGTYCSDAVAAIRCSGTSHMNFNFLTTSRPDNVKSCNTVPVAIIFESQVRHVTLTFAGARITYTMKAYDSAGNLLGTVEQDALLGGTFEVTFSSKSANISCVTFGRAAAVTKIMEIYYER